jgi:hypothetical protein
MSDYRNPNDPFPPGMRNPNRASTAWAWSAGAALVIVVLAVAFGVWHQPKAADTTLANNMSSPAVTRTVPPITPTPNSPASPSITPAPVPAPAPVNPTAPNPSSSQ